MGRIVERKNEETQCLENLESGNLKIFWTFFVFAEIKFEKNTIRS